MSLKVGINGFGRIGRTILRQALEGSGVEVVHVNDLASPKTLAHLLKYDSLKGRLGHEVSADESSITVARSSGALKMRCTAEPDPAKVPWQESGCEVVLECTGRLRDRDQCAEHLGGTVKKVLLSAPGDHMDHTLVLGVNHHDYRPEQDHVVSNASCTTNCLAPVAMILHQNFGIRHGFMTTVHSYTSDQRLLDGPHRDLRRARAAAVSQVPTSTGAAKAIGLVLPELDGKLQGMAIRVPTPNVSLVDLVLEVEKACTPAQINQAFQQAAGAELQGILDYTEESCVSVDYNGSVFSAVVDGLSTKVIGDRLIQVIAWYDNETGFSQRMLDLAQWISK